MSRKLNILTGISGVGCVIVLILSLATSNLQWEKHSITVTQNLHIAFFSAGVWFYNGSFPYKGETWMIGNPDSKWPKEKKSGWSILGYGFSKEVYVYKNDVIRKRNACDLPGIYYRRFEHSLFPGNDFTLMIRLWYLVLFFAILPTVWFSKRRNNLQKILSGKFLSSRKAGK